MEPVRTGQDLEVHSRRGLAMLGMILVFVFATLVGLGVVFGLTPDTRQPGRYWYPAGPDPEPWRTD